ncbi:hypothetical protein Pla108_26960 [Botrimarina colliarenosi]|uniref:DUF3991 domain-containing protein n=1 Tax=Botrimarina colliarenosi TaxID=2528001 RepID=A0A5C6ABX9_9BACT|nr:toprim domain-containing protein [Botrimarina colliarenosi]TWT96920.1 hypothetical protein Pla108_26960 [Botrimarina colliarenosi]
MSARDAIDRATELEAFKRLDLTVIASDHGYEIDRRKSTRHSALMASGKDKIIVAQNGRHYVYCSVYDPQSSGSAVDFAQRVIEPGCSLGRVRQLLRPYLSTPYFDSVRQKRAGSFAAELRPSEPDLIGVAVRYARFEPVRAWHNYLNAERGVPLDLMLGSRLRGRVRHCPRSGAVVFPHWGLQGGVGDGDCVLVGYEIKGSGTNLFSKGGRKGLWMSAGFGGDRTLAFAESGLDAVSYLAIRQQASLRVASVSGQLNPQQPELIRRAIERMEKESQIVAAFDNDEAGDRLTTQLHELLISTGRSDLAFSDDRPKERGADWNDALKIRKPVPAGLVVGKPEPGR